MAKKDPKRRPRKPTKAQSKANPRAAKKPRAAKPKKPSPPRRKPSASPPGEPTAPQEVVSHVLGPVEKPGETLDADEARRRLEAGKIEAIEIAKQIGLDVTGQVLYTPHEPPTPRAAEIKQVAGPLMDEAAAGFRYISANVKITAPDGSAIEIGKRQFEARIGVRGALEGLAKVAAAPFQWAMGLTMKIGKWVRVKATGKGKQE
ncbi:MAG: hypothetical protein ACKVW3_13570 [Phycisphaerales bacterium]